MLETPPTVKTNPLTTVTPFSKALASIIFVALPFLGFYLGVTYQKALSRSSTPVTAAPPRTAGQPTTPRPNAAVPQPAPATPPVNFYDFAGVLSLEGYLKTIERPCAFSEDATCKVKLAAFVVLQADDLFKSFLKDLSGNAYATEDGIVLGCIDEGKKQITSANDADSGTVNNLIKGAQYDLLMGSGASRPINLSVEKPKLTGGRGAPDCYSHFRNFSVTL